MLVWSCYFICEYCTMVRLKMYEGILSCTGDCFSTNWNNWKELFVAVNTYFLVLVPTSLLQTEVFWSSWDPCSLGCTVSFLKQRLRCQHFVNLEIFFHYVSHECMYWIRWVFHFLRIIKIKFEFINASIITSVILNFRHCSSVLRNTFFLLLG